MTRHTWCGSCGKQIPIHLEVTVQRKIRVGDQLKPLILYTWCARCYHTALEGLHNALDERESDERSTN